MPPCSVQAPPLLSKVSFVGPVVRASRNSVWIGRPARQINMVRGFQGNKTPTICCSHLGLRSIAHSACCNGGRGSVILGLTFLAEWRIGTTRGSQSASVATKPNLKLQLTEPPTSTQLSQYQSVLCKTTLPQSCWPGSDIMADLEASKINHDTHLLLVSWFNSSRDVIGSRDLLTIRSSFRTNRCSVYPMSSYAKTSALRDLSPRRMPNL